MPTCLIVSPHTAERIGKICVNRHEWKWSGCPSEKGTKWDSWKQPSIKDLIKHTPSRAKPRFLKVVKNKMKYIQATFP